MHANTQEDYDALVEANRKLEAEVERLRELHSDESTDPVAIILKLERERDELRALLREVWDGCQEIEWWSRYKAALGKDAPPEYFSLQNSVSPKKGGGEVMKWVAHRGAVRLPNLGTIVQPEQIIERIAALEAENARLRGVDEILTAEEEDSREVYEQLSKVVRERDEAREALRLYRSMVLCGERESDQSKAVCVAALGEGVKP